jgi:nicotinamidase-related amidase
MKRISRQKAGLLVVDVQERLLPAIDESERVVRNCVRLIEGAGILNVPVFATEQYPKGLGRTVPEIARAAPAFKPVEKLCFSACGSDGVLSLLKSRGVEHLIVCGIEAHVCVWQTVSDLREAGLQVFVVADAISSRRLEDCRIAIQRMRDAGAAIVSLEMVLFELLERAGTDEFRRMLQIIK